jgi:hypothetical protein
MDAFGAKPISLLQYRKIVHSSPTHKFCIFFTFQKFTKCPKTLPNIIQGPRELNACIWCKTIFATSVPRNSAFTLETKVFYLFT